MTISPPATYPSDRAVPHDHQGIDPAHRLIRRVSPEMIAKGRNGPRLSSAVLEPSSQDVDPYGGLSVDLEALMLTDGVDPAQPVGTAHSVGAIVLAVSAFRSRHFLVGYDPLPENPYHGAVWENAARSAKLTRGTKRALLKEAAWLVALPGVAISEG